MTRKSKISDYFKVFKPNPENHHSAYVFQETVPAGFPSPAEDYIETSIDLNEHFIPHPSSTYVLIVSGDSMIDAGIYDGDYVVVDRSLEPQNNDIIIASVNNEFTIKRFFSDKDFIKLVPENPNYKTILITPDDDFKIWGVVTGVLRKLK